MQLRYNFRLYPTPGQRSALARAFGCARVVFNDVLRVRREAHEQDLPYPSNTELSRRLITEAKHTPERAWLGEVSAVVLQQSLADANTAYKNFFDSIHGRRKGPTIEEPRFKSRRDHRQAIRFTRNARFSVTAGGKLSLPKIGDVKVRWSRQLPSAPSSVTVVKDSADRYFASFVVATSDEPLPDTGAEVGIDVGLTAFAVLSDGTIVENPRFLRRAERKLGRAQKWLARTQEGSRNRDRARRKVARAHARVADARRDFHHKLSTRIVRENQAVHVETLSVKGLARTRLAKSVHDAGWSAFLAMLEYKAARYGRTFVRIDRRFPSSQLCSACGRRDGSKPLHVRKWACPQCGAVHDRDHNAAKNILAEGRRHAARRAERLNACRADVRPEPVPAAGREAGTHRERRKALVGIPGL